MELVQAEDIDLILLDLMMPDMNGFQVLQRLKQHQRLRTIPVIALTAHAMASDHEKATEAGCDDFDTKPVELPRLLEKIERLLGHMGP